MRQHYKVTMSAHCDQLLPVLIYITLNVVRMKSNKQNCTIATVYCAKFIDPHPHTHTPTHPHTHTHTPTHSHTHTPTHSPTHTHSSAAAVSNVIQVHKQVRPEGCARVCVVSVVVCGYVWAYVCERWIERDMLEESRGGSEEWGVDVRREGGRHCHPPPA